MDSTGVRIVFHAPRSEAARMVHHGLAVRHDSREIRLTCNPLHAAGHSLPQYTDGQTIMLGPPLYTHYGHWTGAYGRRR
jgi:hypothetical protein